MGRRDEALAILQRVIDGSGNQSGVHQMALHLTGLLQMAGKEWAAAAQAFDQAADHSTLPNPTSLRLASEAYLEKARRALQVHQTAESIEAIDQAIAVYENERGENAFEQVHRLRRIRARAYAQSGNFDAAIRDLRTVVAHRPDDLAARITLASLYTAAGRFEALRGLLDPIAERTELEDIYAYFEGRLALAANRAGTARRYFERALESTHGPNSRLRANLHFYRALCLQRLRCPDEAATALDAAIQANFRPETADAAIAAADLLRRQGRADDAVPILEAVTLNRIDESAPAWALLGRAQRARGETALALSAFNESLRIDRKQPQTLALRGSVRRNLSDFEGAISDFESALALNPESAATHYGLGLCKLRTGATGRAARAFSRASELDPDNASLHLFRGLLAFDPARDDAARSALRQYAALVPASRNPIFDYLKFLLDAARPKNIAAKPAFALFVDY